MHTPELGKNPQRKEILPNRIKIFDGHFHIIDYRFPLIPNNGYLPREFTLQDYKERLSTFDLVGGTIVSGSFQGFNQDYLLSALKSSGPGYAGVTQLPHHTPDSTIIELDSAGVRALRFNLYRGGPASLAVMIAMAKRVHELVKWHIELYLDSTDLEELSTALMSLPSVCIDHLGIKQAGFHHLLKLAEKGHKVKATGFGRIDFSPSAAIKTLYRVNPDSLVFGTDLPSTRAAKPFQISDVNMILNALGREASNKVLKDNAIDFYKIQSR